MPSCIRCKKKISKAGFCRVCKPDKKKINVSSIKIDKTGVDSRSHKDPAFKKDTSQGFSNSDLKEDFGGAQ